ncbi:hypothetical protein RV12_GL002751 [Enterococcus quebecensis]|uniref:Uncharacterized protein n=2 Tax=Enterococcus quebecensis TaxID=903983 RepID=A0A1E5GV05_9ENTE|nr:hypothetical protein BCR23_06390 [Enterococcus quebecensis]OJG74113.1 hypothetical protein RV12_GL002751 [Enterococcus quebecensis]
MKFQSFDSLKMVQDVIEDAALALEDTSRKLKDSPLTEVISGAIGIGIGTGIGFAGLWFGGSVVGVSAAGITSGLAAAGGILSGGMVAGIAVLATPAIVLGIGAVSISMKHKKKRLDRAKELLCQKALEKQAEINDALREEIEASKERIDYLLGLSILLESAIKDLKHDLGLE